TQRESQNSWRSWVEPEPHRRVEPEWHLAEGREAVVAQEPPAGVAILNAAPAQGRHVSMTRPPECPALTLHDPPESRPASMVTRSSAAICGYREADGLRGRGRGPGRYGTVAAVSAVGSVKGVVRDGVADA